MVVRLWDNPLSCRPTVLGEMKLGNVTVSTVWGSNGTTTTPLQSAPMLVTPEKGGDPDGTVQRRQQGDGEKDEGGNPLRQVRKRRTSKITMSRKDTYMHTTSPTLPKRGLVAVRSSSSDSKILWTTDGIYTYLMLSLVQIPTRNRNSSLDILFTALGVHAMAVLTIGRHEFLERNHPVSRRVDFVDDSFQLGILTVHHLLLCISSQNGA